ncbi:hypothetical protein CDAR_111431 [Caerostris darwini]|uniref:Uncharacterized protein n=1 Tax=Caerostris darwini TaxID=1538125 RepID=A0AAV4WFC5_9ARAC|nr:hypothetical protein CDAR_111431 [Caerostris darwini]
MKKIDDNSLNAILCMPFSHSKLQKYISADNAIPKLGKLRELSFFPPLTPQSPLLSFRRPSAVLLHLTVIVVLDMGEISKRLFGLPFSLFPLLLDPLLFLQDCEEQHRKNGGLQKYIAVDNAIPKLGKLGELFLSTPSQSLSTLSFPSAVSLHLTVIVVRDMGEISKRLFGFSLSISTSFRSTAFSSRMRETATQERWVDGMCTKAKPYIYFDHLLFFKGQLSVLIFQTQLFKVPEILKRYFFRTLPKMENNDSSPNIPEKTMKIVAAPFAPLL